MKYRSNSILAHIPQNVDGKRILEQSMFFQEALEMRIFLLDTLKTNSIFPINVHSLRNQLLQQKELNRFTVFVKKALQKEIPNNIILRIGWGKTIKTLISESESGGYEFAMIDKSNSQNAGSLSKAEVNKFVSKSHCPVLSVNKDHPINEIKSIIVPIDISQRTKKRLYWATFFAKKLNAKIQIVSALNINIEERKSLAYKNAERLKGMLEERGVKCDVKILKTHNQTIQKAVLDYIEQEKPGMVIIRTHQEIRFSGRNIGKFVSEIIHGCKIPVFTVGGVTRNYNLDLI